jgi:hypothetical protein
MRKPAIRFLVPRGELAFEYLRTTGHSAMPWVSQGHGRHQRNEKDIRTSARMCILEGLERSTTDRRAR